MRSAVSVLVLVALLVSGCASEAPASVLEQRVRFGQPTALPTAPIDNDARLADVLVGRRSGREFSTEPLTIETIGQLFWAAQGITDNRGHRTSPSAGARYPLEVYAVTDTQILHYLPDGHRVEARPDDRTLHALGDAAFGQAFVSDAPVVIVISAIESRTEEEYGALAGRLVDRESGHASQNVLLQATALGLTAAPVGGFDPDEVAGILAFTAGEEPLYLIPVGHAS